MTGTVQMDDIYRSLVLIIVQSLSSGSMLKTHIYCGFFLGVSR